MELRFASGTQGFECLGWWGPRARGCFGMSSEHQTLVKSCKIPSNFKDTKLNAGTLGGQIGSKFNWLICLLLKIGDLCHRLASKG